MPLISVIMPVYNGEKYLREAMDSVLGQTFSDFEFLICNDGSTDNTEAIIKSYHDCRIKYFKQANQGLAQTLNNLITKASGKYLARQDHDDVSLPQRFEKQVVFLDEHKDHGMVGTWSQFIVEDKLVDRYIKHPTQDFELRFELMFRNSFVHSSVMIRREVFDRIGLYCIDKKRQPPEDYELWPRIVNLCKVGNLPEVLHRYREVKNSLSRIGGNPYYERIINLYRENIGAGLKGVGIFNESIVSDIVSLVNDLPNKTIVNSLNVLIKALLKLNQHSLNSQEYQVIQHRIEPRLSLLRLNYPGFSWFKFLYWLQKFFSSFYNRFIRFMKKNYE